MNKQLTVLVLRNVFTGAYEASRVFDEELAEALIKSGCKVCRADNLEKAKQFLETKTIDFSIGFGVYDYLLSGIPLYEHYQVPHYQWVSDNPIKVNIDSKSKWITYIFTDQEFWKMVPKIQNEPLIFPLGYRKSPCNNIIRKNAVLVPCKIRSLTELEKRVESSKYASLTHDFIANYHLDDSFIAFYVNFVKEKKIQGSDFFLLINELIRIKKRCLAIRSITGFPLYLLGEDMGNFSGQQNIHYISNTKFDELDSLIGQYRFVLNIDPNYFYCLHDRFTKCAKEGTLCITNKNGLLHDDDFTYSFSSVERINELLAMPEEQYSRALEKQGLIGDKCRWIESVKLLKQHLQTKRAVDSYLLNKELALQ